MSDEEKTTAVADAEPRVIDLVNRHPLHIKDGEDPLQANTVICQLIVCADIKESEHYFADMIRSGRLIPAELFPETEKPKG